MDKQFDHKIQQLVLQQFWNDQKTYTMACDKPVYTIDTPPPTVSGSLHIGHIFSYTQTDIIARYCRMNGLAVFYPLGFDDNGLPTEKFVEKKLEINAHTLKRSDFINVCLQETHEVEQKFKHLWQQIGLSVDWNLSYSTISATTRKISQESFIKLFEKGFIYRKHEPALYCTTCRTTVAQAELDDLEKPSTFSDIVFCLEDGTRLIVGTTRPELLPSCVALLYNPRDERYKHLAGQNAIVPLFDHSVPILADESVLIDKGTGLVMCCTFGDKTDIAWYKKFNLPYRPSIGDDGKWLASTGLLAGMRVHTARETIINALKVHELLINQKAITHSVNVHERCKKEIEYLAITQWFLSLLPHKENLLKLADEIEWFPSFMKSRYINWVQALSWDWCLSRQRFYGIPFPVWHCSQGHIIFPQFDQLPIDPQETPYQGSCPQCGSTDITPDTDVMDTWNSSSLTPQLCYQLFNPKADIFGSESKEFIPMSMRPQAHDIIRTWAFYTIIKSWMHYGKIPWKQIVISGHVLSDGKEKLSKSKENSKITPENLLEQYPADVIRYWTASGRLGQDVAFSENQLKIGLRLTTKLWNAFRFIQEHMINVPDAQPQELGAINEWILTQSSATFAQYHTYFKEYEFSLALDSAEQFFWNNFCDNYIEIVKEQFFKPERYPSYMLNATRWTLHTVGLHILQRYAPYMPYITESLYQEFYRDPEKIHSLHQTTFDSRTFMFEKSVIISEKLINLIGQVRALKTEQQLSLKVPVQNLEIYSSDQATLDGLKELEAQMRGVTHAQSFSYVHKAITKSYIVKDGEVWNCALAIE